MKLFLLSFSFRFADELKLQKAIIKPTSVTAATAAAAVIGAVKSGWWANG